MAWHGMYGLGVFILGVWEMETMQEIQRGLVGRLAL